MVLKHTEIKAIIFDLDGVILNVHNRYYASYVKAFETKGIFKRLDKKNLIQMKRRGLSGLDITRYLAPDADEKLVTELDSLRRKLMNGDELLYMDYPFPGVRAFLERLKDKNITLVALTLRSKQNAKQQLERLSLLQYFDKVVTEQDVDPVEGKYSALTEILRKFKLEPQNVLFVDDTKYGIRAGHRLGIITVGVLSGLSNKRVLEKEMPHTILKDVTRLTVDKVRYSNEQ
jgi:HAD superfamily hydrolase (TIGR01509 family)